MANIFQNYADLIASKVAGMITGNDVYDRRKAYYDGRQARQLKVLPGKTDDNILSNLVGLAVDRSVSHVLAGGVEFDWPESEEGAEAGEAQEEYIDDVWEANKKALLLNDAALNASVYGTGYIKIKPDGITDPYTGAQFPRLIVLDPEYLTIETNQHDAQEVLAYIITYNVVERGDRVVTYRETTRKAVPEDYVDLPPEDYNTTWMITMERLQEASGNVWQLVSREEWPYDFPPIIHWKNLPSLGDVYGSSDLDDILGLQDKENFVLSNLQKMVRLQAHKQPWGRSIGKDDKLDVGPDKLIKLTNPDAELGLLDFTADITGSLEVSHDLRQMLFDISREVDITSITDKIGALTNFGLRVLYSDTLSKVDTKRMFLEEMLTELNRRLLVLAGNEGEASRPGAVRWNDPLPSNKSEDIQALAQALSMGVVSKRTVAEKLGFDWDVESTNMAEEKGTGDNALGAAILRAFPGIGGGA